MASKVQRLLSSAISRSEFPNVAASRRLIATTAQNQKPPPNFEDKVTGEGPTHFWGLPPHTKHIGLPESRVLYTVLRSPHIDKKSREQFQMKIKKKFLVIEADRHELRNKFFWLKHQRIFGAQYEILISCKTRLDKGKLQSLL